MVFVFFFGFFFIKLMHVATHIYTHNEYFCALTKQTFYQLSPTSKAITKQKFNIQILSSLN